MNNFSTWLAVVMLIIFSTMVGIATTYPPGARFMPYVIGIPGMLLCAAQLVQDYLATRGGAVTKKFQPQPQAGVPSLPDEEDEFGPHTVKNEIIMWAYFLGFITGILLFGFHVSIPILVFLYLHFEAKVSILMAGLAAAISIGLMWFLFEFVLRFHLHEGFITQRFIGG